MRKRADDKHVIEWAIMQHFQKDFDCWPMVSFDDFFDLLFKTCRINFSQTLGRITDDIANYLCPEKTKSQNDSQKRISIKLLRDLILDEHQSHQKVWLWGLKDERVGFSDCCHDRQDYDQLRAPFEEFQEPKEF